MEILWLEKIVPHNLYPLYGMYIILNFMPACNYEEAMETVTIYSIDESTN